MISKSKSRKLIVFFTVIGVALLLSSCASQPTPTAYDPPGFFMGILHGFLILLSFMGSIFMDIRMYAFPNSGVMYDLGYLIGASMFLGGGGASAS